MSVTLFNNARIITATGVYPGTVTVSGRTITDVTFSGEKGGQKRGEQKIHPDQVIDVKEKYLSPGFIDIHTHGAGGYDFMDGDIDSIYGACLSHLLHGTTSILPTTLTSTKESLLDCVHLFNTVELERDGYPSILGLHLEGPYFADSQRGAQDPKYLRNPEPEEYLEVLKETDRIRRWSFAIELPGSREFLRVLKERGIVASLAHSAATCTDVFRAYEAGLSLLTHFYSCMTTVQRVNAFRVAGAIEAGYLLDDLYVELIADGCHLPAELLKLVYKVKSPNRICLVTDSMRAAGMPDGEYVLGSKKDGQRCIKEDGVAKLPDRSAFAGSVATTDRLVRTFRNLTGAPIYEVVDMASLNPAILMGIDGRKGSIAVGKDADILIFDENIDISRIMVRGEFIKES